MKLTTIWNTHNKETVHLCGMSVFHMVVSFMMLFLRKTRKPENLFIVVIGNLQSSVPMGLKHQQRNV